MDLIFDMLTLLGPGEYIKGSLEVGKLADLVILSGDFLTVPDKEIESMRALATRVGGKFVYTAPDYR